ncbi:cysteine desulfurase [Rhodoferax sp.]|uniref:cysteine desulfurase n=1 Tax=Rhodoferax sp. TaxID=50421 RepID=UPI002731E203|nr:cysteine desulfurase [Rhodoferax sp.]MDP1527745.1 cysteine desulfurase [Rhodoferax sp.]MDP1945206.1 cysteine desulfurase [Rhodoferax sp.]MDP2442935.1 cysteine desulfurase [Rhodoferax sp.]MDZ4208501.1 cysteine desulfurase [Rhodoferax sp.]
MSQSLAPSPRLVANAALKATTASPPVAFDVERIRADFPILGLTVAGKPLVYLDNAASSQMPQAVIDRLVRYQTHEHANIHRAVHYLSETATAAYEAARITLQRFINAAEAREVIFTSGTTESINLVAQSWGRQNIRAGDEIILTVLEHHSNIVPWQMLAQEKGATIRVVPMNDAGELLLDQYQALFNEHTRLVSVGHVSNALGSIHPVKEMIAFAHARGVPVLVDGAQAAPHLALDVQDLDCDFYAFSGHKLCGPTGIGILYGRAALLEAMPPFKGGGDMIHTVTFEKTTYAPIPNKFEAGTPPIAAAIGLAAAADYLGGIGMAAIAAHEHDLLAYATAHLAAIPGVRLLGTAQHKAAVLSFALQGIHPHDVGTLLNQEGVAVRTGHHCAQPLMARLGVAATSRASFAFYNTRADVDALVAGIRTVQKVFA